MAVMPYIGTGARIYIGNTADATSLNNTDNGTGCTIIYISSSEFEADDARLREALDKAARQVAEFVNRSQEVQEVIAELEKLEPRCEDSHRPPVTAPLDTPAPPGLNDEHGPQWLLPSGRSPAWQRPPP